MRRALAAVLLSLALSGCSETLERVDRNGMCVEHKTDRILGLPLFQQEWACEEDDE